MMRASSPRSPESEDGSVTVTARHMADAVGYLTRVANDAGLPGIAGKLTHVRTSLLEVVAAGAEHDDAVDISTDSAGATQPDGDENDDGRNSG